MAAQAASDVVVLARAWAEAATGDEAERLGDALSLEILGDLGEEEVREVCACASARLASLGRDDDDDDDDGCAKIVRRREKLFDC